MTQATPTRLRNGDWGARARGEVSVGDVVHITTRGGKEWDATVARVLWTGDGVSIVATERQSSRSDRGWGRGRGTWTGCSCGSVEEFEKPGDCWQCRHDR